jgi:hypothetical protein
LGLVGKKSNGEGIWGSSFILFVTGAIIGEVAFLVASMIVLDRGFGAIWLQVALFAAVIACKYLAKVCTGRVVDAVACIVANPTTSVADHCA